MKSQLYSLSPVLVLLAMLILIGCTGETGPTGSPGISAATIPSVFDNVEVQLGNSATKPVGQITITVPDQGYVLVQAVFDVNISKPQSVEFARAFFSLHTDGTSEITNKHEVAILRVSGEPTTFPESFIMPVSIQHIFSVTAGQHTFFLRGARNDSFGGNTIMVTNKTLSAIYLPI